MFINTRVVELQHVLNNLVVTVTVIERRRSGVRVPEVQLRTRKALQAKKCPIAPLRAGPRRSTWPITQAARALMGKENSERVRERGSRANKGAVKEAK